MEVDFNFSQLLLLTVMIGTDGVSGEVVILQPLLFLSLSCWCSVLCLLIAENNKNNNNNKIHSMIKYSKHVEVFCSSSCCCCSCCAWDICSHWYGCCCVVVGVYWKIILWQMAGIINELNVKQNNNYNITRQWMIKNVRAAL